MSGTVRYDFIRCGGCQKPAMAVVITSPFEDRIDAIYPSAGIAPDHLPKEVASRYSSGLRVMGDSPEAAGMMFRKALEVGLRSLRPDDSGDLYTRINKAAEAGAITPDLQEWAHRIRDEGNAAAHDDAIPSRDEILEFKRFTELVLLYLFTLPGMLTEWSEKKEADA